MASSTSFKQQCPSCEAMVPIRDPGLIGRKIDCPKCKYRFVVENPGADETEEDAAKGAKKKGAANGKPGPKPRDEEDAPGKPKKKQEDSSKTLFVGIGLAVVAVGALAVGGILLFGGGKSTTTSSSGGGAGGAPAVGASEENKKPAAPPTAPIAADITNLLPNDTQVVLSIPVLRLRGSLFSMAALRPDNPAGFTLDSVQKTFGFPLDDVARIVTALNPAKNWVFTVVRTSKPIKEPSLVAQLKLTPASPINNLPYYLVGARLDGLSNLLMKANHSSDQFALHVLDPQTLVLADLEPMKKFLEDKTSPKHLTEQSVAPEATPAAPESTPGRAGPRPLPPGAGDMALPGVVGPPKGKRTPAPGDTGAPGLSPGPGPRPIPPSAGMPPSAGAPPGPGGSTAAGGSPMPPRPGGPAAAGRPPMPSGPGGPPGAGGPGQPGFQGRPGGGEPGGPGGAAPSSPPDVGSWLTINPALKSVLDKIEKTEKGQPVTVLTVAVDGKLGKPLYTVAQSLLTGANLSGNFVLKIPPLPKDAPKLPDIKSALDSPGAAIGFSLVDLNTDKISAILGIEYGDDNKAYKDEQELNKALAQAPPWVKTHWDLDISVTGQNTNDPNQVGYSGMPAPGGMPYGPGPGMRGNRGLPGGGFRGEAGPGPGFGSRSRRDTDARGPGFGRMQQTPRGGFRGGPGGIGPGGIPGAEGQTDEDQLTGEDGKIGAVQDGSALVLKLDLNFKDSMHEQLVHVLTTVMVVLKGEAEVAGNHWRIFELAAAVQGYADKNGHFPQGAQPRSPSSERVLDWRPDQRLSWLVELLPFFGGGDYQDLANDIERDKSWNEGKNLFIAQVPVPQFLARGHTDFLIYPGHKPTLAAATHYVGIAGVGLDAAAYDNKNPRRGVFGYDRVTAVKDIKDGPEQTIVLIQVPADQGTPWMAGGGSTVRGVAEDIDCAQPFVCTEYQGRKGTFAVMADGKVRFIPVNIRPEDFRALCTIAGNDRIRNLEKIAPEVPAEDAPSELKTNPAGGPPLDKPAPPAAPDGGGASVQGDLKQLQGTWKLVGGEAEGVRIVLLSGGQLIISGDKYTLRFARQNESGTLKLDPTKKVKAVDVVITDGPDKGKTQLGIYELSGDDLKFCFAGANATTRPTAFAAKAGSGCQVFLFKRQKG